MKQINIILADIEKAIKAGYLIFNCIIKYYGKNVKL